MSFVRSFIACIRLKSAFLIWTMKWNGLKWNDQMCIVSKPIKYNIHCTCIVYSTWCAGFDCRWQCFKCSHLKFIPTHIIVLIFLRFCCATLKTFWRYAIWFLTSFHLKLNLRPNECSTTHFFSAEQQTSFSFYFFCPYNNNNKKNGITFVIIQLIQNKIGEIKKSIP